MRERRLSTLPVAGHVSGGRAAVAADDIFESLEAGVVEPVDSSVVAQASIPRIIGILHVSHSQASIAFVHRLMALQHRPFILTPSPSTQFHHLLKPPALQVSRAPSLLILDRIDRRVITANGVTSLECNGEWAASEWEQGRSGLGMMGWVTVCVSGFVDKLLDVFETFMDILGFDIQLSRRRITNFAVTQEQGQVVSSISQDSTVVPTIDNHDEMATALSDTGLAVIAAAAEPVLFDEEEGSEDNAEAPETEDISTHMMAASIASTIDLSASLAVLDVAMPPTTASSISSSTSPFIIPVSKIGGGPLPEVPMPHDSRRSSMKAADTGGSASGSAEASDSEGETRMDGSMVVIGKKMSSSAILFKANQ